MDVRPFVAEIRIGSQGIAFDRLDLDAWVDQYKSRNGRPGRLSGGQPWDARERPVSTSVGASGKLISRSTDDAFAKALARIDSKGLMPWIGQERLDRLHMGTLTPYIEDRRHAGRAAGTINHGLKIVRRILNLAATEWMDEHGLTWLDRPPKIRMLPDVSKRQPYPLSWDEQERLFKELPRHLANVALFAVNTGCRDQEICGLKWDWEVLVPELETSVFIIPAAYVKNGDERLVVLNRIARSVLQEVRGQDREYVFSYQGKRITRIMNSAWLRARKKAELPHLRVHDLKHTYGRRLRAAGVSFEDRQDLLGHRSGRITTHYSAAELSRLLEASERVCDRGKGRPELVV